jgi:hypothetical protein
MNTDRELLELAAKAAGIDISDATFDGWGTPIQTQWNPLKDDGDALRLAVKLCLDVTPAGDYTAVRRFNTNDWVTEEYGLDPCDPYAATRRAIVRAAAEIGRSMA